MTCWNASPHAHDSPPCPGTDQISDRPSSGLHVLGGADILLTGRGSTRAGANKVAERSQLNRAANCDPGGQPEREFTQQEVNALLQRGATGWGDHNYCRPENVRLHLGSFDAAAGSRFTQLVITNVGKKPCTLGPHAGLGLVGHEDQRLDAQIGQSTTDINGNPVTPQQLLLKPGGRAWATMIWSGSLAGAEQDSAQALVVQLGPDTDAALFTPRGKNAGRHPNYPAYPRYSWGADPLSDLGYGTTVRLGPWVLATP